MSHPRDRPPKSFAKGAPRAKKGRGHRPDLAASWQSYTVIENGSKVVSETVIVTGPQTRVIGGVHFGLKSPVRVSLKVALPFWTGKSPSSPTLCLFSLREVLPGVQAGDFRGLDPETVHPEGFAESATYLVWPAGYDLRENGPALEVLEPDGNVVGRIGDRGWGRGSDVRPCRGAGARRDPGAVS